MRVLSDIEHGVPLGMTEPSKEFYFQRKRDFGPATEAWLFFDDEDAAFRGFVGPSEEGGSPKHYSYPCGVLINGSGDQMWLHGVMCGTGGEGASGARTVLRDAGFTVPDSIADYAEMHFVHGKPARGRRKSKPRTVVELTSASFPGQRLLRYGDLVALRRFNPDDTAADVIGAWSRATASDGWIGAPRAVTFYTTTDLARQNDHQDFQLIASGSNRRGIWMHFPQPYFHPDPSAKAVATHEEPSSSCTAEAVAGIFHSVGVDIANLDARPAWKRILGIGGRTPSKIQWASSSVL